MMNNSLSRIIFLTVSSLLLLSACGPKPAAELSPEEIAFAQTRSFLADQTRQAIQAQTQEALKPALTPTSTFPLPQDAAPEQVVTVLEPTLRAQATTAPEPSPTQPAAPNPNQPQPSPTYTPEAQTDPTSAPTSTSAPQQPETTPEPGIDWNGYWTAYYGEEAEKKLIYPLLITITGSQMEGFVQWGLAEMTFAGTLSNGGRSISGRWSIPPASGDFSFFWINENQFFGNTGLTSAFCGSRNEAEKPVPCFSQVPFE